MLVAEELLLVGTAPDGRNLLGSYRTIVLGGALLTELVVRERLDVDDRRRLRVVDGGTIGDPLLDDAMVRFAERVGKKPKDVLARVGKKLERPLLDSLVRRELVRPEPVRAMGLTLSTRWPALTTGPRDAVLADLARVVTGAQEPDSRTGALISLLHAVDALPRVLAKDLRPGLSNGEVKRRGKEVTKGRWASEAVLKAVQEATAATITAVGAAAATGSSG
jgi:hypothetical protein